MIQSEATVATPEPSELDETADASTEEAGAEDEQHAEGEAHEAGPDADAAGATPSSQADDTGASGAEQTGAQADVTETAEGQQTPAEPDAVPFSFRVDGRDVAVEGAVQRGDDIVVPRAAWQKAVQPYLADAGRLTRESARLRQQVSDLDPERNETVIRAQKVVSKLDAIAEALEKGDEGPLAAFVNDFSRNLASLKVEAENEALRKQVTASKETQTAQSRQDEEAELLPQLQNGLRAQVEGLIASEFKDVGFKADEWSGKLWKLFERGAPVFIDLRDPAKAQERGVAPDLYVDLAFVTEYMAEPARVVREHRKTSTKAVAAAKHNAAVLTPKKTPATLAAKGSPESGGKDIDPTKAKDQDEYNRMMREKYGPV